MDTKTNINELRLVLEFEDLIPVIPTRILEDVLNEIKNELDKRDKEFQK